MNLITLPWLKAINKEGKIVPINLLQIGNPEITNICHPRADFRGAIYQFLIGLLQTCFAPGSLAEWKKLWDLPPSTKNLLKAFSTYEKAFDLELFMQDCALVGEEKEKSVASLFIEAPGELTIKENRDHFINRNQQYKNICVPCAAMAIFTLQINAPSGGQGHRVGLRGGGPLTTLIAPYNVSTSLWQKLWLNVFSEEEEIYEKTFRSTPKMNEEDIFPWLAPVRISENAGTTTCPLDTHPLQMYWAMPRRIRLDFAKTTSGECDICGDDYPQLISHYYTKNYGVNYAGSWMHPLTPYRLKEDAFPLSLKGEIGGIGYRHWLGLALKSGEGEEGEVRAAIVNSYYEKANKFTDLPPVTLWVFGYDMDKMKARCWHESIFPLFKLDFSHYKQLEEAIKELLDSAKETLFHLRNAIKWAWFTYSDNARNMDFSFVSDQFYERTENFFYVCIRRLCENNGDLSQMISILEEWLIKISAIAYSLLNMTLFRSPLEDLNMRRIMQARKNMNYGLYHAPTLKIVREKINIHRAISDKENI